MTVEFDVTLASFRGRWSSLLSSPAPV